MYSRSFTVAPEESRERLDRFLERHLPEVSQGRIRRAILAGEITINGEPRDRGRKLAPGDSVELRMPREPVGAMQAEPIPLAVLYEDDALIAVDKPAPMLSHPTWRVFSGTALNGIAHLVNREAGRALRPRLVHRLDRMTSGVLVASKTSLAHEQLSIAFGERRVAKRYLALLCGRLSEESGTIDAPIGSVPDRTPGFGVMEGGRAAVTRYRRLGEYGPYTLVELVPLTGRTNQLRIHCDHVNAPIAGDDLHGLERIARFREAHADAAYPGRLFLHAAGLEFDHPETASRVRIESPLPAELADFLSRF